MTAAPEESCNFDDVVVISLCQPWTQTWDRAIQAYVAAFFSLLQLPLGKLKFVKIFDCMMSFNFLYIPGCHLHLAGKINIMCLQESFLST